MHRRRGSAGLEEQRMCGAAATFKGRAALTFPKANALAVAPSRGVGREPQPWPGLELGLGSAGKVGCAAAKGQ